MICLSSATGIKSFSRSFFLKNNKILNINDKNFFFYFSSKSIDKNENLNKKDIPEDLRHMDSLMQRALGSDSGIDARGQPISLHMKLYWTIFGFVMFGGVIDFFFIISPAKELKVSL